MNREIKAILSIVILAFMLHLFGTVARTLGAYEEWNARGCPSAMEKAVFLGPPGALQTCQ